MIMISDELVSGLLELDRLGRKNQKRQGCKMGFGTKRHLCVFISGLRGVGYTLLCNLATGNIHPSSPVCRNSFLICQLGVTLFQYYWSMSNDLFKKFLQKYPLIFFFKWRRTKFICKINTMLGTDMYLTLIKCFFG